MYMRAHDDDQLHSMSGGLYVLVSIKMKQYFSGVFVLTSVRSCLKTDCT